MAQTLSINSSKISLLPLSACHVRNSRMLFYWPRHSIILSSLRGLFLSASAFWRTSFRRFKACGHRNSRAYLYFQFFLEPKSPVQPRFFLFITGIFHRRRKESSCRFSCSGPWSLFCPCSGSVICIDILLICYAHGNSVDLCIFHETEVSFD